MIKKNITINYAGRLYHIDEDACNMLMHYSETLHRYFSSEGNEEVAEDIDLRIAELLDEKLASGANAVSIEIVETIIHQIGDIKDIAPNSEPTTNEAESKEETTAKKATPFYKKRLYRDTEHRLFAGVFSGLGHYFGVDPLWMRLIYLIIIFFPIIFGSLFHWQLALFSSTFNFAPILLYLIMAFIMPVARTPEEKLQMQGKEVTPQSLADEVTTETANAQSGYNKGQYGNGGGSGNKGCAATIIGGFFRFVFVCLLFLIGAVTLILLFAAIIWAVIGAFNTELFFDFMTQNLPTRLGTKMEAMAFYTSNKPLIWLCVGTACAMLAGISYCCFHAIASITSVTKPMSLVQRICWLAIFAIGTITFISTITSLRDKAYVVWNKVWTQQETEKNRAHTHNGFYFNPEDEEYFKRGGWTLLKAENLYQDHFTYNGEHYSGDYNTRYLDANSSNYNVIYQAERTDSVAPGSYTLTCAARQARESSGACIYAIVEDGDAEIKMIEPIIDDGNTDGELGNGWNTIKIEHIAVPKGAKVRYGVSTDPDFTGMNSRVEWFSACDFKLRKEKE